jgi:hypothetical protein
VSYSVDFEYRPSRGERAFTDENDGKMNFDADFSESLKIINFTFIYLGTYQNYI